MADEDPPQNRQAKLVTGSIPMHLVTQTAPMMVGGAALMSIGIIDAYFIGQLGPDPLAAIAFIFPVTVALSSLGVGVLAGISSVVSRALGEGDDEKAQARGNLGLVMAIGFGLAIAAALVALQGPLFRLMQADDAILPLVSAYMTPFALGFPLLLVSMGMNGSLRAQGLAKRSSAILVMMAITNWILDPILISGVGGFGGFGIAGAAYATIAGWLVAVAVATFFLQRSDVPFRMSALRKVSWGTGAAAIGRVAGPAAFSNSINPVGLSVLTGFLAAAAGQDAVAGFGAGGRIQSFAVVPLLSLSASIGPIVGQNFGAGKGDRVRQALLYAGGFCVAYGLAVATALVLARGPIAGLFSEDASVRQAIMDYLMIAAWGFAGFGLLIVANGALNALDRAGTAMAQSLFRVAAVMVPAAILLPGLMDASGIYAAELAANLIGGAVAVGILWYLFWHKGVKGMERAGS